MAPLAAARMLILSLALAAAVAGVLLTGAPAGAQSSTWVRPPTQDDVGHAAQWVTFSAEQGEPWAQYMLGTMYEFGHGMPRDDARAFTWYAKAAEGGDVSGQYRCGLLYHEGRGTAKDDARALEWLRRAEAGGSAEAANLLGVLYALGNGAGVVTPDEAKAVELWKKAAAQGVPDAQFNLAAALANGRGVEADPRGAARWYVKAAYTYLDAGRRTEAWRAVAALAEVSPEHEALEPLRAALTPADAPAEGTPPPAAAPPAVPPDAPELQPTTP